MTRAGVIGFGEAGRVITRALADVGWDVVVYDAATIDPPAPIRRADSLADLASAHVVLSLVTPASALAVAEAYAPHASAGQLFVDLNSTGPAVKEAGASALSAARYVDGVMTGGGITLDGHRIPMLLAGPDATEAAGLLISGGLDARVIGDRIGAAAALKMLRSTVVKGWEALWVEALLAAEHYGLVESLIESVGESIDRSTVRDFASMLATTHAGHAHRRSVEVEMVRQTIEASGVEPIVSRAVVERFERSAAVLDGRGHPRGAVPPTVADALAVLRDPAAG